LQWVVHTTKYAEVEPKCHIDTYVKTKNWSYTQSRIKGYGDPGQFSLQGPYDVFYDVIVCKIYVFADSQRSRLLFPVLDYVPAVLTGFLAAFDGKAHEIVLKINVSCP